MMKTLSPNASRALSCGQYNVWCGSGSQGRGAGARRPHTARPSLCFLNLGDSLNAYRLGFVARTANDLFTRAETPGCGEP